MTKEIKGEKLFVPNDLIHAGSSDVVKEPSRENVAF